MLARALSHRTNRSIALALLLALTGPAVARDAGDLYRIGVDAFSESLFDVAAQSFEEIVKHHRDSSLRADATFLLALSSYHLGQYERSLEQLETFAGRFPESDHVAVLDHWRAASLLAFAQEAEADGRMGDAAALAGEAETLAARQLESEETPKSYSSRARLLHAAALFQTGQLAYRGGRYRQAVESFERVLGYDESPQAPYALFALAEASLAAGNLPESAERLVRYLELFPDGELAPVAQARLPFVYLSIERFGDAMAAAEAALKSGASAELSARLLQVQGEAALQLGELHGAVIALNAALDAGLDPGGEQRAAYYLSLAYLDIGRRSIGIDSLQRASGGPDADLAASASLNRAYLLIEDGELAAGAEALQQFADTYPNHLRLSEALQILARTREALGETGAALDAWERLSLVLQAVGVTGTVELESVRTVPVSMLLRAADAAVAIDQDDRALVMLARLRNTEEAIIEESLESIYRIGRIYGGRGEHMRAASFYREVVQTAPQASELAERSRLALGAELFNAGRYQEALTHLRDDGGIWEPYRRLALGRVYYRLGESDAAVKVLQNAAFAPDAKVAAEASYLYAAAQFQGGRFEAALRSYLRFTDRFPDSARVPSALYRAALSELRMGRPQEASKLFASALNTIEFRETREWKTGTVDGPNGGADVYGLAPEILFIMIDEELANGRVDKAASALEKLRLRVPKGFLAAEAGLQYGEYLVMNGQKEAGLRLLRQVAADHKETSFGVRALFTAAQAAEGLGRYADAVDLYWRNLLAAHDTGLSEQALAGLQTSFASVGAVGAEPYYLAAKEASAAELPPDVRARVMHDYALLIHPKQPDSAAEILSRALPEMSPGAERDDAYFMLAAIYRDAGKLRLAIDAYQVVADVAVSEGSRQAMAALCRALILVAMDESSFVAANELTNVALRHPEEDRISSEALYHAVELLQADGVERSADRLRERLLKRYPVSWWAGQLRERSLQRYPVKPWLAGPLIDLEQQEPASSCS